ncbi:MAG TPA: ankyrin repeat domain-containing protein, partial [Longimicrobiales bacterium]|nr:ankyrin repeat domain-containing protein [Longimicrobiales bacterium]
ERGATVTDIVTAAGVGRLDLVERMAPQVTSRQLGDALHQAAAAARLDMVRLLIDRGAPLEKLNAYGGTVLDGTLWYAYHADVRELARLDYPRVIDALIEAGARTDVYPGMAAHIEEIRERTRQAMS